MLVAAALLAGTISTAGTAHAAKRTSATALIVTATDGKRTKLAPLAERQLAAAARREGLRPVVVRTKAKLTEKAIRGAATVVFAAGSGTVLKPALERALNERVRRGRGVVFVGSAMGLQPKSGDFSTLLGAEPSGASSVQNAEVQVVDHIHPATARLPRRWQVAAPWVSLKKNPAGRVHVLAWVDERSYRPGQLAMGVEHPVTWCRDIGDGRAFTTTLGTTKGIWSSKVFRRKLQGAMGWAAGQRSGDCGATIWSNWKRTVIDTDITDGTQLDVGPDGRVYYIEHTGSTLKIYDPVADTVKDAGYVPSVPGLGQGLLGLAVDVNFVKTRWVYLYYHLEGLTARLSRFTLDANDQLDRLSEKVLLRVNNESIDHNGGGLAMQGNGDLWVAIGDNSMPHLDGLYGSRNPQSGPPGQVLGINSEMTTQNTDSLLGKVLRIHPEPDGTYTIPKGNMFPPGTAGARPEIFTMGHRNAFHVKVDDLTGEVLEGDVGPDADEDSPEDGPKGYDEFNLFKSPANFGWPYCIADNKPYIDRHTLTEGGSHQPFDCNNLKNPVGAIKDLGPATKPLIWYPYGVGEHFPEMSEATFGGTDGGRLAIPGPKYRPFEGSRMPLFYDDSWFIADWTRNWIKQVILDEKGQVLRIQRFAPDRGVQAPIDMDIGADGSLYVIEWGGQTIPVGNPLAAKVVRYQYQPKCGTCDPTVVGDEGAAIPGAGAEGNVIAGPLAQTAGYLTTSVTLAKGSSLNFSNLDAVAHNVASTDVGEDGRRLFAAPNIAAGTTVVEDTDKLAAGKYGFLCTVHPSMTGTLEVR